jgi:hypothetical protein
MQLNDVQNLEVVHRYENFDRESTGVKFRDKKEVQYNKPACTGPFRALAMKDNCSKIISKLEYI